MPMTHYMELLAVNQPWNLILFMAVPVILAETVAITELFILFSREYHGRLRSINRAASIIGGIYFIGVFYYVLTNAAIPLTQSGQWRGPADVIAVGAYMLCVVPLVGMALLDLGLAGRSLGEEQKLKQHAIWVAVFLIVAHIAMIFGMLDPNILSATPEMTEHGSMHSH
ncbi:MAG: Permease [Proteobacteria bacterium]|nr:Permease [Pseudomonadota bacterium]